VPYCQYIFLHIFKYGQLLLLLFKFILNNFINCNYIYLWSFSCISYYPCLILNIFLYNSFNLVHCFLFSWVFWWPYSHIFNCILLFLIFIFCNSFLLIFCDHTDSKNSQTDEEKQRDRQRNEREAKKEEQDAINYKVSVWVCVPLSLSASPYLFLSRPIRCVRVCMCVYRAGNSNWHSKKVIIPQKKRKNYAKIEKKR